ncbi:hypothetical protein ES703_16989 [subsurface metagenome]
MADLEDVVAQLKGLNSAIKKLLEISGLDFALEPTRYMTRKVRTGEATPHSETYYQEIAPAATFTLTFTNPTGFVWIPIIQTIDVSQNGVFEFYGWLDDAIIPAMYLPRLSSQVMRWSETIPFGFVMKESGMVTYVNHDAAVQWILVASLGILLRKEVWERDSKLMDEASERYIVPPPLAR